MLTACGGGSGTNIVNNFFQNDLSNLSGSNSIVSSYSNLLSTFQATISGGEYSTLQAVITGPDAEDISTANTLLEQLQQAESLWAQSETLIANQSNIDKYKIYNSSSYKEAYAAMIYLRDHVKPIIIRVSRGKTITIEQLNKVAKEDKAQEIINTEKTGSALEYAQAKQVVSTEVKQSTEETYNQTEDGTPVKDFSNSTWEIIEGQGGKEKRTVKVTTPQTKVVKTKTCTWTETTKLSADGTAVTQTTPSCSVEEVKTELSLKIEDVVQYQEGSNPVVTTEILADVVSDATTEWNSSYGTGGTLTVTTKVSTTANTPEVVAGSELTATVNFQKTKTETTGTKNQIWVIIDNWIRTTVTKPAVSTTSDNVVYNDTKTKQKRTWTITTKRKKVTYKDGTSEIIETQQAKVYTDWETIQTEIVERTVKENEVSSNIFLTPNITENFVAQASKTLKNNAYTDDDEDIGTQTTDLSTNADDFKTTEFNKDTSKSMINADKAYARGWTGKGAVLGVIDSFQETDHEALDGKYKWYNNYVRYEDGTKDSNGNELGTVANGGKYISHGTHVAGIIAGKRDGNEFHGVAFDAELVGANIDYYGSGSAHMSYASNALQDIVKLKSSNAQGGEGMNIVAVNMSFNKANPTYHYGTVTQLSDGTYSAQKITDKMQYSGGGAQYWKVATDNDIILVNSAGNGLYVNGTMNYDYALDPGIWASETDTNGNLVLGGKMIIVGNWGGTKANGQVLGSKAGHVCLNIVNDVCNDTYMTSDFYILAPGNSVYSSASGDGYLKMGGSSMAAPQVTGAMGILHQMWPHMKGENLVKLVLNTADTNINGYNVNIHGQGMLDLDEATQPQGAIGIPTTGRVDGALNSLNNTYFATGNTSAFSALSGLKIMVIDDYDRDYYMNLGSGFAVKDNRKYSDVDMLVANNNIFLPTQQMYGSFTQGGQYNLLNNYNFGLYTGDNGAGDYSANIGKNFILHKNFKLKTSIGQMSEQETWLGNSSDGALGVGDNNNTNFGNLGVEYTLGNNILSLNYTKGYSDINTTDGSMIKNFSDIVSESYRIAYEMHKDKHTTLGWSFSLPSHIISGTMDLEVAESVNLDGTINYTDISSNLKQTTKEKNLGFFYSKTPDHDLDATFNFTAEYRQDVAGQNGKDGVNLAMNYVKKFNGACGFFIWKNPKCYNADGSKKDMEAIYVNNDLDNTTKHGFVYDLKTDKFIPIENNDD
ncbi:S8 family peptidase [Candidatus Pelagibacter bacterium nBUS_25]|uniref:S8 family peptidase n=1 Tax=Candidatus Pelagibacter bacterium nBUS_25 TaxID=3374187 RepID=UPI003EBEF075